MSNPCQNNGLCNYNNSGFVCACLPVFSGQMCENGRKLFIFLQAVYVKRFESEKLISIFVLSVKPKNFFFKASYPLKYFFFLGSVHLWQRKEFYSGKNVFKDIRNNKD